MNPIARPRGVRHAAPGMRFATSSIRPRLRRCSGVLGGVLIAVFGLTGRAQLLVDHVAFHDSIPSVRFNLESGSVDNGGTMFVFLRHTDTAACTVSQVFLNTEVTAQCTFFGGPVLDVHRVGITKVAFTDAQSLLDDFAVLVTATRASGGAWTVAALVRLFDPWLPIGTWSSSMFDADAKLQFARSNLFDVVVGTGNGSSVKGPASRYFVRANSDDRGTNDLADPNQVRLAA